MGDYGFRVAKAGFDVKTATPDQLAMTSAYLSEKVALYGNSSLTVTAPATSAILTIAHNLGYVPQVKVYEFFYDRYAPFIMGDTTALFHSVDVWADTTNLKIRINNNRGTNITILPYYQILYNST
jgi:hypothetical protein